ncbi:MAG: hypothetical protein OXF68_10210 [Gammaproteobacteria bacterium]|nr:hypothetical protein [Gammaproteobacteria bacterium]MCY4344346.1 hypothetical protein [Gammaproteobacteria bacterium]
MTIPQVPGMLDLGAGIAVPIAVHRLAGQGAANIDRMAASGER